MVLIRMIALHKFEMCYDIPAELFHETVAKFEEYQITPEKYDKAVSGK
jgi:hypothetical protein